MVVIYQHQMFTARICCCSATVASQVMAIIAIIVCAIAALTNWIYTVSIFLSIYQTVLVLTEIAACILVFFAVSRTRPAFVIPIIVIQIWNTLSLIGTAAWTTVDLIIAGVYAGGIVYNICMYVMSLCLSLFIVHCHVCCYKALMFKIHSHMHQHHHNCAPPQYNV